MDFLNSWLQEIILAVVISTIIEMIMPNGNNKKYIKVVLGLYIVFNIITPIVNKFINSNFEISSIIDINKYTKEMNTYEKVEKNNNISKSNEESIKQIYISNLRNDIKAKLEDKDYSADKIEIEISNDESYKIEKLSIYLKVKEEKNSKEKENVESSTKKIEEVEKVDINIQVDNSSKKDKNENKNENKIDLDGSSSSSIKDKMSKSEIYNIKKYLSNTYEIKENQIEIY